MCDPCREAIAQLVRSQGATRSFWYCADCGAQKFEKDADPAPPAGRRWECDLSGLIPVAIVFAVAAVAVVAIVCGVK
jgi:hypothetical protein